MLAQTDGTAIQAGSGGSGQFGVACNAALVSQTIAVQWGGTITIGATIVVGTDYCISETFGGICTFAALLSGSAVTVLGKASTTTILDMGYSKYTGLTKA